MGLNSFAQKTIQLSGVVFDTITKETLPGTIVRIEGAKKFYTSTDVAGEFSVNIPEGHYLITLYLMGYDSCKTKIDLFSNRKLIFNLKDKAKKLKEVSVIGEQNLAKQNGDTTEHNALAYKLNSDATAEDLVKKLPGTTIENGTVKSNGEEVKKVTVDGKDFFGDDVSITLKNLPADIISSVQIYDKSSDQANFTGFKDGNTTKTMNIKTKNGIKNSVFGKAYGSYGTSDRYNLGGNINYFSGNRRISLITNFNNINQQNFSIQDILGTMGMGNMPKMPGGMNPQMMQGMMGSAPGGLDLSDYFTTQQSGINTVNATGLNYSDAWGKKINVSGSYFYNDNKNKTESNIQRQYFLGEGENQYYKEKTISESKSENHRVNFKLQYNIDSANTLIITPRITFQSTTTNKIFASETKRDSSILNTNNSITQSNKTGYMFSGTALYNHKFAKSGRTISLNLATDQNQSQSSTTLNSDLTYFGDSIFKQNQLNEIKSNGKNYSANITYTEKAFKNGQLLLSYNPSYSLSDNNNLNYTYNDQESDYNQFNSSLSNKYSNNTINQKLGVLYAWNKGKINFNAGSYAQDLKLNGNQKYPSDLKSSYSFKTLLPTASFTYKSSFFKVLRLNYRTSTNIPGISQMQNVIDNSNPTSLSTGNPYLKQQYDHNITLRYNNINLATSRTFFVFASAKLSQNYIGNKTYILFQDTTINNYFINRGTQLTTTQNLNGYSTFRSFMAYGFKVRPIKSNLNFNFGGNYTRTPVSINNKTNLSEASTITGGLNLSSNISEKIDFTIGYTGNYNISVNSIQSNQNNNYYYDNIDAKLNLTFFKHLVFTSEFQRTSYYGLAAGYNQKVNLLSSSIAYKFLKNNSAEIKLSAFDLLNNNNSITRTISSNYIEDNQTKVLTQYFMLYFTYTFKHIKAIL
ncbi:MAG: outer membrane beta-barrel protein [Bacteroidia bacterium]|nr:outer membrane beta-barrel protein [Bacteroidia bacterium]